jgi:hypothetical protein
MPIRPFLYGQAFDPEAIRDMSLVFENVCEAMGLKTTEDPATTLVAQKVMSWHSAASAMWSLSTR